jgi:hypothetical protein
MIDGLAADELQARMGLQASTGAGGRPAVIPWPDETSEPEAPMKDITVTVDDDTYRRAELRALVRSIVETLADGVAEQSEIDRLERLQTETIASLRARGGGIVASENLPRDRIHERDAFR